MSRIPVNRRLSWEALRAQGTDLLLVSALAVIGLAYGLGYRLDWSEENGRPEEDQEVAEITAPASLAPAAAAPPVRPAEPSISPAPDRTTIGPAPAPSTPPQPRDVQCQTPTAPLRKLPERYP